MRKDSARSPHSARRKDSASPDSAMQRALARAKAEREAPEPAEAAEARGRRVPDAGLRGPFLATAFSLALAFNEVLFFAGALPFAVFALDVGCFAPVVFGALGVAVLVLAIVAPAANACPVHERVPHIEAICELYITTDLKNMETQSRLRDN